MYTKSCNIEIVMSNETNEVIEKLFESLLQNYWKYLEETMRGSEFARDSNDLLYYKIQKIGLKRGLWYIDSPEWLKNKKATINPKNNDDNCFQYALTVALNHQNIENILKEYRKLNLLLISKLERNRFSITLKRLEKVWTKQ